MPEQGQQGTENNKKKLSPEQVRELAKKVYELWLKDLTIEKERRRFW
jgi:hypothetical protein